jgi:hypothetical protein
MYLLTYHETCPINFEDVHYLKNIHLVQHIQIPLIRVRPLSIYFLFNQK